VPAVGEPIYGGTLTWGHLWVGEGQGWVWFNMRGECLRTWHYPYTSLMIEGDVDKYGPRGTNEFQFMQNSFTPESYSKGALIEDWEVSADEIVLYLRPGVMFAGNEHIGMEPREITADDFVWSLGRRFDPEEGDAVLYDWADGIEATDRYTVVIHTSRFYAQWCYHQGIVWTVQAPETYAEGVDPVDWRNQVSTGPFILTDYVPDSQFTYESNPYYWETTTINGKEYQLPFIDKLIYPVILDVSTQIAALRTGSLEYLAYVSPLYSETLDETSPDLLRALHNDDASVKLQFNCSEPPFDDVNVRRAMWKATDLEAINDAVYMGLGVIHNCPVNPLSASYTPLEELRPACRELYEYDPDEALDMLTDASYPEGFTIDLTYRGGMPEREDIVSLLAEQWALVNVSINPIAMEWSTLYATMAGREGEEYHGAIMHFWGNDPPFSVTSTCVPEWLVANSNFPRYFEDEYWDEAYVTAQSTVDPIEQLALLKELDQYYLEKAIVINFAQPPVYSYWWPWLKNYYGELNVSVRDDAPIIARIWIDQDMKEAMGH